MGQAEKMLKTLVEEGWFERSKKGFYSLSPRALMELRGWLIETYNDLDDDEDDEDRVLKVKLCFACKEIITQVGGHVLDGTYILTLIRAKDVPEGAVPVDYTIYVHRTSSGCRKRRNARCAKPNGLAKTSLVSEQSRLPTNICKVRDEVAVYQMQNEVKLPPPLKK